MMPTISQFYGIQVVMHFKQKEHYPPHLHARYGENEASFYLSNGEIFHGDFPARGKKLIKEFILKNKKELMEMWDKEIYKKLPPIK